MSYLSGTRTVASNNLAFPCHAAVAEDMAERLPSMSSIAGPLAE
jgi:hypothetical protein